MNYEQIISKLTVGTMINFREYRIDRHEKKHLSLSLSHVVIADVFPANKTINRETLETIFGEGLTDNDYLVLSTSSCFRFLLNLGTRQDGVTDVKVISLNKDFYDLGYQEIDILANIESLDEPNYTLAQRGW